MKLTYWWIEALVIAVIFFTAALCYGDEGLASWYSTESCQREGTSGTWTASGERFSDEGLTCAMRSRDFGKYYKITNRANDKSVIVRHNDFGPNKRCFDRGVRVDLSKEAYKRVASLKTGLIEVLIEVCDEPK